MPGKAKPEAKAGNKTAGAAKKKAGAKKKTTGVKKVGGARGPALIDGIPTSEMSRDQLQAYLGRVQNELEREREERNYFQLERDKVHGFWELTKQTLDETRAQLRLKEKDLEDAEHLRQADVAAYKQRIKFLFHEHQEKLADLHAENQAALELNQARSESQESEMRQELLLLNNQLAEQQSKYGEIIRSIKIKHGEGQSSLRSNFQQEARLVEERYQKRLDQLRQDLETRAKTDLNDLEERCHKQVARLTAQHEKSMIQLKNYYNDIVLNNMGLIASLKEQVENLKKKEDRLDKQIAHVTQENAVLRLDQEQSQKTLVDMKKQVVALQHAKASLVNATAQNKSLTRDLESLKWHSQVLEQSLEKVKGERDELQQKFVAAILEVQQKANLKHLILEKRLSSLQNAFVQAPAVHPSHPSSSHTGNQAPASSSVSEISEQMESFSVTPRE